MISFLEHLFLEIVIIIIFVFTTYRRKMWVVCLTMSLLISTKQTNSWCELSVLRCTDMCGVPKNLS